MTARNAPAGATGPAGRWAHPRGQWAARRSPAAALAAVGVALAALLAGCGIRTTTVPVDAGPAPSRVACAAPKAPAAPAADVVVRKVFLVCNTQVTPVNRSVEVRDRRVALISGGGSGHEPAHAG